MFKPFFEKRENISHAINIGIAGTLLVSGMYNDVSELTYAGLGMIAAALAEGKVILKQPYIEGASTRIKLISAELFLSFGSAILNNTNVASFFGGAFFGQGVGGMVNIDSDTTNAAWDASYKNN